MARDNGSHFWIPQRTGCRNLGTGSGFWGGDDRKGFPGEVVQTMLEPRNLTALSAVLKPRKTGSKPAESSG
jgi:hypothetical protein